MRNNAFTLVELAIVLVIIGLLVGGVLAGQELVAQAKIRKQIALFEDIERANATFRAKYNAFPGDYHRATSSFAGFSGTINNGNNNKLISDIYPNTGMNGSYNNTEVGQYWVHLNASGLFSLAATGALTGGIATKGVDYPANPATPVTGATVFSTELFLAGHSTTWSNPSWENTRKGNYLSLNTVGEGFSAVQYGNINRQGRRWLSSTAASIDTKIDDGNGLRGKLYAPTSYGASAAMAADLTGGMWVYNSACVNGSGAYINLNYVGGETLGDAQVNNAFPCYLIYRMDSISQ